MPNRHARCTHCAVASEQRTLHCQEVVLQHADGTFECAGGGCRVDVRVHRFVVTCAEVDCADCGFSRVADDEAFDLSLAA